MPVRHFDEWAAARAQQLPLAALKDTAIGIDATLYLKKFTSGVFKEPLVPAIGGTPFMLRHTIQTDLRKLKEFGIKPVFVFDGLSLPPQQKPLEAPDEHPALREKAWELYDKSMASAAVDAFRDSGSIPTRDVERFLMDILRENDVDFQVAPYLAVAQLAYLESNPKGFIDAIWAPSEIFLFDVEKAITNLNVESQTFQFVNKKSIQSELSVSPEQFIDALILSGSDLIPTFPPFATAAPQAVFKHALDTLQRHTSATRTIKSYPDAQVGTYLTRYQKLRTAIKHHPIFTDAGNIELLNLNEAPGDIHEIIGKRLPDELFFYLSRGVISTRLIDMFASGQLAIRAPLDGGDSEEFRKLLDTLNPICGQALSLIVPSLHRYWLSTSVDVHYWFNKEQVKKLVLKEVEPKPSELVSKWNVREEVFKEKLGDKQIDLSFALSSLQDPAFAAKTITEKSSEHPLKTKNEIILNTYWRFLQLRGFIDKDTHQLTSWGKALQSALEHAIPELEIEEAIILGFELLRAKSIKFGIAPGPNIRTDEEERKHVFLISRIASLASLRHTSTGYTGPLSKPLLAFNSLVNVMQTILRQLIESVLGSILLSGESEKYNRGDWYELSSTLPFGYPTNCAAGIAAKTYLDNLCDEDSAEVKEEKKRDLMSMFRDAEDVEGDVDRGWMLWGAIVSGIRTVEKENIVANQKAMFDADQWLITRI